MNYAFDTEHASLYGLKEAIIIQNMMFWIKKNIANGRSFHDGRTWTYNSIKAFTELFPFWSSDQIRRILKSLINQGVIMEGNFNKANYDRTKWYAFVDAKCILQNHQMDMAEPPNGCGGTTKPIPDINTDINTDKDIRTPSGSGAEGNGNPSRPETQTQKPPKPPARKTFKKPIQAEVYNYMLERMSTKGGITKDRAGIADRQAHKFIDYHDSRGWKVGRTAMKDWQASVRTWISNDFDKMFSATSSKKPMSL